MLLANVTMILDNQIPHEMGEYSFAQLVTPADVADVADEMLEAFERFYCPSRMLLVVGTETEVWGQVTFDESGTYTLELA